MRSLQLHIQTIFLLFCCTGLRCNKKFDSPPAYTGPDISANMSIRDVRAMHFMGSYEKILEDLVIEGIVVANDSKDNFYKSIILQDSTGGITLRMEGTGLYNDYPLGAKLAIKLKTLWLGDYARMVQLGASVDRSDPLYPELKGIPAPLFNRFVFKKSMNNDVIPRRVLLEALHDSLQSCLVSIENVEFAVSDTGKTFADALNKTTNNATLRSCTGGSAYVRTSGFANFSSAKIPRGNGRITAVYSVFKSEKQLLLRDTSDLRMSNLRCTAAGYKTLFEENFEAAATNIELALTGWQNIAESGGLAFVAKKSGNNIHAEASAFATGKPSVICWLITPAINLSNSANEVLQFQTRDGFDNGAGLQVYVSTNYDGSLTPSKSKWVLLKTVVAKGSVSGIRNDWVNSGSVDVSGYGSKVWIAFRYGGSDPPNPNDKRTTLFQLDNIRVYGN